MHTLEESLLSSEHFNDKILASTVSWHIDLLKMVFFIHLEEVHTTGKVSNWSQPALLRFQC